MNVAAQSQPKCPALRQRLRFGIEAFLQIDNLGIIFWVKANLGDSHAILYGVDPTGRIIGSNLGDGQFAPVFGGNLFTNPEHLFHQAVSAVIRVYQNGFENG